MAGGMAERVEGLGDKRITSSINIQ
ncbi:hypothetical protein P4654_08405 [Niallia taxi]|nr:hypothetical protein [Niallia taxi]MED4118309.1 hypothetical protein [Niallia taxi]